MGFLSGGGKKQAKAIKQTAEAQAAADREAARGAQLTTETMLAQDRAARQAAELLSKPQGTVEVDLESLDENDALIRGKYSSKNAKSAAPIGGGSSSGGSTSSGKTPRQRFPRGGGGGLRI